MYDHDVVCLTVIPDLWFVRLMELIYAASGTCPACNRDFLIEDHQVHGPSERHEETAEALSHLQNMTMQIGIAPENGESHPNAITGIFIARTLGSRAPLCQTALTGASSGIIIRVNR